MKIKPISFFLACLLLAAAVTSLFTLSASAKAPELGIEVVIDANEVAEEGSVTAKIYIYPCDKPITVPTFNFALDFDKNVLTLVEFNSDLSPGALPYLPTANFAFCYNEYAGIEAIDVDRRMLAAEAVFEIADIIGTREIAVGLLSGANYTIYNDPDDPIYIGYTPELVSDTVTVLDDDVRYLYGDINSDGAVNNVDAAIFERCLANWDGYGEFETGMMDVDGSGTVNPADAVHLVRALALWDGYTIPEGYYVPEKS